MLYNFQISPYNTGWQRLGTQLAVLWEQK